MFHLIWYSGKTVAASAEKAIKSHLSHAEQRENDESREIDAGSRWGCIKHHHRHEHHDASSRIRCRSSSISSVAKELQQQQTTTRHVIFCLCTNFSPPPDRETKSWIPTRVSPRFHSGKPSHVFITLEKERDDTRHSDWREESIGVNEQLSPAHLIRLFSQLTVCNWLIPSTPCRSSSSLIGYGKRGERCVILPHPLSPTPSQSDSKRTVRFDGSSSFESLSNAFPSSPLEWSSWCPLLTESIQQNDWSNWLMMTRTPAIPFTPGRNHQPSNSAPSSSWLKSHLKATLLKSHLFISNKQSWM